MEETIDVHTFKDHDLSGGSLIVSVPHPGIGNILLTDFLLDHLGMDHMAALDGGKFPPVAMIHNGKARFPIRIHADPETRIAVLRSEFPPAPELARPIAKAIVAWAEEQGIERIVCVDTAHAPEAMDDGQESPNVLYAASLVAARDRAERSGLDHFTQGALGGVTAMLMLYGRAEERDVLTLVTGVTDPMEDAKSVLSFAKALPGLVPELKIDPDALHDRLQEIEGSVRKAQHEAQRTLKALQPDDESANQATRTMYR